MRNYGQLSTIYFIAFFALYLNAVMFKWLEQYFIFTKGERNGIIALLVLILLVLIAPRVYLYFRPVGQSKQTEYLKEVDAFARQYRDSSLAIANAVAVDSYYRQPILTPRYFNFDPNKIGVAEWQKLGFTEKQAITIEHYKAKGAKFYVPEDLKKLFVMTPEHYMALLPFVKIDKDALPPKTFRHND
jgi:competence protein ComEA